MDIFQREPILLTGFSSFGGEILNPSERLVARWSSRARRSLILPVEYHRAEKMISDALEAEKFASVLLLGQAGGRTSIGLERVALNLADTPTADESGEIRLNKELEPGQTKARLAFWPLYDWAALLKSENLPVEVSFSAGAFVCNAVYFRALQKHPRSLFVHVPYLPEQVSGKAAQTPSLTWNVMEKTIGRILDLMNG